MEHNSFAPQKFPGYILALTGPSGVGKSTISRVLARVGSGYTENVAIITTRAPKRGDDGEYVYTTPGEFECMKQVGAIVAATRIPSSSEDRQYGYRAEDIEVVWRKGKVPIVITEIHLLEGLAHYYGRRSILSFGLLPPGKSKRAMLSQLLHRLRARGRDTEEQIGDRLRNAELDMALFDERTDLFDHILVNEDLLSLVASMEKKVSVLLAV
jgi:guanylate kinase